MVCPYVMVELDLCNECTEFVGYAHNFIKGLRYKDQFLLFLSMSTSSLGCQRMIIHLEESYILDVGAPISSFLIGGSQAKSVPSWWTTRSSDPRQDLSSS